MKNMFQQINQLDRQIGGIYHEAALKMGFSDSELWILYALSVSAAGCRQTELCQSTGMTKTTVNSALKKIGGSRCTLPGSRQWPQYTGISHRAGRRAGGADGVPPHQSRKRDL